jgi:hypothetical protein
MPTVRHARDVLGLVQRWAAAGQRGDAGLLDGDFAGVGPLRFVLTRDQWLARFPQRPGKPVPGHPGLGHRPPAVAARRMTMPPRTAGIPGSRRDRRVLSEPDLVGRPARPARPHPRQPARARLLPAQPHAPVAHAHGLIVLTLVGDKICAVTRFGGNSLFPHFGLPRTLPD